MGTSTLNAARVAVFKNRHKNLVKEWKEQKKS
jgi:hypothetical protein